MSVHVRVRVRVGASVCSFVHIPLPLLGFSSAPSLDERLALFIEEGDVVINALELLVDDVAAMGPAAVPPEDCGVMRAPIIGGIRSRDKLRCCVD